eukprot:352764-Chlamydomonas_euryale.AAC.3
MHKQCHAQRYDHGRHPPCWKTDGAQVLFTAADLLVAGTRQKTTELALVGPVDSQLNGMCLVACLRGGALCHWVARSQLSQTAIIANGYYHCRPSAGMALQGTCSGIHISRQCPPHEDASSGGELPEAVSDGRSCHGQAKA